MSRFVRAAAIAVAFSMYPFATNCGLADDPVEETEEGHAEEEEHEGEEGHEEEHEGEEEHEEGHEDHEEGHDEEDHGDGDHEHEAYPVGPDPYFRTPGIQNGSQNVQAASTESLGHIEDLAANLRYLVNHITFEMHYNYQSNPGFQEVYAKCYELRNLGYTIYDMEHSGEHVEMSGPIHEFDELFHSIEEDIAGWQRTEQRPVGHGDLQVKMELLEDLMHHFLEDTSARSQILIDSGETTAAPETGAPAAEAEAAAPVE